MRVLAVLLAACLFLGCSSKPVPERHLYKRDDADSERNRSELSRDFVAVDDMLSTLDQCFHVLQKVVENCEAGADNRTSKSQELSDEREDSDRERTGIRRTDPTTEPPTTPPTVPPRPNTGTTIIVVHGQEEKQGEMADQQGIGDRDKERGRTETPPTKTVIVHVDRNGKEKSDDSAETQTLRKGDGSLFDRDSRKEQEEEEATTAPPQTNIVIVHVDREDEDSETADASSQAVGKDRDKGRDDGDDEKPTPDVIVIHINRQDGDTDQEEEGAASPASLVAHSRRKQTEAPTEPTSLPTAGTSPPRVIIIHTDGKTQDVSEEVKAEGLRRTEPPTNPPTEPPTHRSTDFSKPPTDVIIVHLDQPSDAEIESDVTYALQLWSKHRSTDPPTEATQAPPTEPPRGPVRIIIIPDAQDESIDEIVSQVRAYSVGDRFRFRQEDEDENLTEAPTTVPPADNSPLIIVIDRRPYPTPPTTTEAQTDPPSDDTLAIKIIRLGAKKLKANSVLKPVSSQGKGSESKERLDFEHMDLDDSRERKEKIKAELKTEGMFMYPVAKESSRENDNRSRNSSADGRDDSSSRRNKTTDVADLPTEEPSATIETDASDFPTDDNNSVTSSAEEPTTSRHSHSDSTQDIEEPSDSTSTIHDNGATSNTEEPATSRHSHSDSTTDTEVPSDSTSSTTDHPSDSTSSTTDHPTDSETTDVSTDDTSSQTDNHSSDGTTDTPTHSSQPESEGEEWPMESVFYEHSVKFSSRKSKKADVMEKTLEDYLHFRRKRQDDSSEFTPQECLQLFGSIIETHYADKLTFLND